MNCIGVEEGFFCVSAVVRCGKCLWDEKRKKEHPYSLAPWISRSGSRTSHRKGKTTSESCFSYNILFTKSLMEQKGTFWKAFCFKNRLILNQILTVESVRVWDSNLTLWHSNTYKRQLLDQISYNFLNIYIYCNI